TGGRSVDRNAAGAWLITGAASGFGRTFARKIAARGAPVALWDRDLAGLEATRAMLGEARVHLEVVDVTDPLAVQDAIDRSASALGSIAHVFNSAGVLAVGPAGGVGADDYRRMLEVIYLGSVHVALAALPQLRRAPGR